MRPMVGAAIGAWIYGLSTLAGRWSYMTSGEKMLAIVTHLVIFAWVVAVLPTRTVRVAQAESSETTQEAIARLEHELGIGQGDVDV